MKFMVCLKGTSNPVSVELHSDMASASREMAFQRADRPAYRFEIRQSGLDPVIGA